MNYIVLKSLCAHKCIPVHVPLMDRRDNSACTVLRTVSSQHTLKINQMSTTWTQSPQHSAVYKHSMFHVTQPQHSRYVAAYNHVPGIISHVQYTGAMHTW